MLGLELARAIPASFGRVRSPNAPVGVNGQIRGDRGGYADLLEFNRDSLAARDRTARPQRLLATSSNPEGPADCLTEVTAFWGGAGCQSQCSGSSS